MPALFLDILDADQLPNAADSPRSSAGGEVLQVALDHHGKLKKSKKKKFRKMKT